MLVTFKYRLFPSKSQERLLNQTLETCRRWYNVCLAERKEAWETEKRSVGKFAQLAKVLLRQFVRTIAKEASCQIAVVAQDTKIGWKSTSHYPSVKGNGVAFSNDLPMSFSVPVDVVNRQKLIVGFPAAGASSAIVSDDYLFQFDGSSLGVCGKPFSLCGVICELLVFRPATLLIFFAVLLFPAILCSKFAFQVVPSAAVITIQAFASRRFLEGSATIKTCVHAILLSVQESKQSIARKPLPCNYGLDAGWGYFAQHLTHKAAWAGRVVAQVNPAYTSKTCSQCGSLFVHLTLADRWVECDCGLSLDRDENAARNLLARGQRAWGITWPVAASVPQEAAAL